MTLTSRREPPERPLDPPDEGPDESIECEKCGKLFIPPAIGLVHYEGRAVYLCDDCTNDLEKFLTMYNRPLDSFVVDDPPLTEAQKLDIATDRMIDEVKDKMLDEKLGMIPGREPPSMSDGTPDIIEQAKADLRLHADSHRAGG